MAPRHAYSGVFFLLVVPSFADRNFPLAEGPIEWIQNGTSCNSSLNVKTQGALPAFSNVKEINSWVREMRDDSVVPVTKRGRK